MTTTETELEQSIHIAATPERVWSLVTDLSRMARWSPQVVHSFVRGPVQLGTRAINLNRRGLLFWPTRSKVVVFEPHREFAFRVKDNATIWAFVLEPTDGGTRLVQQRRTPDGVTDISLRLQDAVLGGVDRFTAELQDGMRQTLARIKADAEA
ncbi:SRPBCC family protein [Nocardioides coralli]|uniref:SRPBCC family protein n=1 Tax=Nocardioides coralli TaxID=2872154 RepID=UPI002016E34A|nr:SRPBCC family protein [Nocardioides coralli]